MKNLIIINIKMDNKKYKLIVYNWVDKKKNKIKWVHQAKK